MHFDPRNRIERHGDVHIVMAGLNVVEALAVQQDERLAEAGAADREVALHAAGRALAKVERGIEAEQVGEAIEDEVCSARRQHADGAIDFVERERLVRAGDDDSLVLLGKGAKRQKKDDRGTQFVIVNLIRG